MFKLSVLGIPQEQVDGFTDCTSLIEAIVPSSDPSGGAGSPVGGGGSPSGVSQDQEQNTSEGQDQGQSDEHGQDPSDGQDHTDPRQYGGFEHGRPPR
jgi:hypothetical protein